MNNLDNCPHYLGNQPKIGFDRNVNIRLHLVAKPQKCSLQWEIL